MRLRWNNDWPPWLTSLPKRFASNKTPGAVVLIGHEGRVVYRRAFGYRSLAPKKVPMTEDTVFDLASLTKPIATAVAVMQLAEQGKLNIDDPVYQYWPSFKTNGKQDITVRQLLTHYSGLKPDLSMRPAWTGYRTAMAKIISEPPVFPPGSVYIYSDINFEALGELVNRVSGLPLDEYCEQNIFKPLGMKDTGFHPPRGLQDRIAPTGFRVQEGVLRKTERSHLLSHGRGVGTCRAFLHRGRPCPFCPGIPEQRGTRTTYRS